MNDNFTKMLQNSSIEDILEVLKDKLDKSEEPDFWKEKIIPFTEAILSVLMPLKEQNLLFNPEGQIVEELNSEIFFRWSDLVCLKTLAFILQESNEKHKLLRTDYLDVKYKEIDLEKLGSYLSSNKVNIIDEDSLDFPMSIYNLHQGMITIIKNLLN
ncbi:hypothetical protein [Arcobacter sp. s6]|jgi:hypothetical protein|uniref:hypothetical protein n=1 Tax=Arcobacter sp. s6 TaxID=3230363 RepID=UPI0034A0AA2D